MSAKKKYKFEKGEAITSYEEFDNCLRNKEPIIVPHWRKTVDSREIAKLQYAVVREFIRKRKLYKAESVKP